MQLYQIIVPFVGFTMLAVSVWSYAKSRSTLFEMIFWTVFWLFIVSLALFPDSITNFIANALGVENNVNAIVFTAIGVLFFMQFNLFFIIKKQNRVITELVRKIALEQAGKDTTINKRKKPNTRSTEGAKE